MMTLNRRRFLGALGLTSASAALTPGGLFVRNAAAEDGAAPKRLILFSTGHGTVYDGWRMRPTGQPDTATWQDDLTGLSARDFSPALAPLFDYRRRVNVLDGLSMVSAERDLPGFRHEKGWVHAWTGGQALLTGADIFSTQPSLDQLVAAQIARPDRLPALELRVSDGRPICHAGYAQQLPLEADPARVYDRLFGLATSDDPLIQAQSRVLDYAIGEYNATSPRLSALDRERLDTHFSLLSQLESRITGLSTATCAATPNLDDLARTSAGYTALFESMADLVAAAFSCDLTRVAAFSMGDMPGGDIGWGDYLSGDVHFDFAHRIYNDSQAALAMVDYQSVHAQQLAYLVSLLESIPDVDGGSLMDNTLIVWGSEMADGWHGYEKYFSMTIGGEWYFKTGQYLKWPYDTSSPFRMAIPTGTGMSRGAGIPHQRLLVSVARAMGLETDVVGTETLATKAGERVSLAGELIELTG